MEAVLLPRVVASMRSEAEENNRFCDEAEEEEEEGRLLKK